MDVHVVRAGAIADVVDQRRVDILGAPSGATLSVLVPELVGVAQGVDDDGVGAENSVRLVIRCPGSAAANW